MIGNACIGATVTGSSGRQRVHPRHARQPRHAVDLGAARAAPARLAVPAHGEVLRLRRLEAVDHVEDYLAFLGRRRRSSRSRPAASPRQTRIVTVVAISCASMTWSTPRSVPIRSLRCRLLQKLRSSSGIVGSGSRARTSSSPRSRTTTLTLPELGVGAGVVVTRLCAPALAPLERGARDALGHGEERAEVECEVPAGVVLAVAFRVHARLRVPSTPRAPRAPSRVRPRVRMMPTSVCMHSCRSWWMRVRVLGSVGVERSQGCSRERVDLVVVHGTGASRPTVRIQPRRDRRGTRRRGGRTGSCHRDGWRRAFRRQPPRRRTDPARSTPGSRRRRVPRPSCSGRSGRPPSVPW